MFYEKNTTIKNIIFAGGRASRFTLTASVLASWMWTTSIIGSVEAYQLYGILGSVAYVGGAVIAFALFIPIVWAVRRRMMGNASYLDVIGRHYSNGVKQVYFLFAFCVSAYVLIEQAVGIAILAELTFGASFKLVSFFSVVMCVVFVVKFGMRGVLSQEKVAFVIICICFLLMLLYFSKTGFVGAAAIASKVQSCGELVFISSARYFIVAAIIAFGQILLDPAYYIKACLAENKKHFCAAFALSGLILWGGISFVCSVLLGEAIEGAGENIAFVFSGVGSMICIFAVTVIGLSTICHYLMGMYGMFAVDFYKSQLKPGASEKECILFGQVMVIACGVFCALIAISLDGISLLKIDMFCAVFFAAPCGPVLVALKSKPISGSLPIAAILLGLAAGFFIWTGGAVSGDWSWMAGAVVSFAMPPAIIGIAACLKKMRDPDGH